MEEQTDLSGVQWELHTLEKGNYSGTERKRGSLWEKKRPLIGNHRRELSMTTNRGQPRHNFSHQTGRFHLFRVWWWSSITWSRRCHLSCSCRGDNAPLNNYIAKWHLLDLTTLSSSTLLLSLAARIFYTDFCSHLVRNTTQVEGNLKHLHPLNKGPSHYTGNNVHCLVLTVLLRATGQDAMHILCLRSKFTNTI
jgi:hypothetical protein